MESDNITIGQLPKGAPFAINSNAIIVTVDDSSVHYWLAPEAIFSSDGLGVARGNVNEDGSLLVKSFDCPSMQICAWIDSDDLQFWKVRMLEVKFQAGLPDFVGPTTTMTERTEDELAEISETLSKAGVLHNSLSDLEIWWGKDLPDNHLKLSPETYMRTKFQIGTRIAELGSPVPFDLDTPSTAQEKIIVSAHLKSLLDGVLYITKSREESKYVEMFHNCVALYSVLVRSELILPRQYDPQLFDTAYSINRRMGKSWQVDLTTFYAVLDFHAPQAEGKELWEDDDVIIKLDEEATETLRELSGLQPKPDVVHRGFIIEFRDPEITVMDNESLIDFLEENGIEIDPNLLEPNKRYTYAIAEEYTNGAFREFFREKGEGGRFADINGDDWLPADLV